MVTQVSPGIVVNEVNLVTTTPAVATSTGAIGGVFRWGPVGTRTLIDREDSLVATFGKPTALNAETFFSAANFLSYGQSLYVVRAANTSVAAGANAAYNAVANTAAVTVANNVVKNRADYDNRTSFETGTLFVAKFPGDLGNSLRVSVCDSVNAFSSNVNLVGSVTGNVVTGSLSLPIGSNTATLSFVSATSNTAPNTFATTVLAALSIGDAVKVGNASIGYQFLTVASKGSVTTSNSTNTSTVSIQFTSKYRLAADFVANSTVNGNTTAVNVSRNWEHFNLVNSAPGTSQFVQQSGNSAAVDTLHIVVKDQDGWFTGVPGSVLEVFLGVSRATDAKNADGTTNYYKNVLNDGSKYIWFANDATGAPSANALNVASSTATVPTRLDFTGGQDGYSEANAPLGILASAYDQFVSPEAVDVGLLIQGKPIGGTTVVNGQTVSGYQLANYIIDNVASIRNDCVVFVSPTSDTITSNQGNEAQSVVNWFSAVSDSTFVVKDSGYKRTYDRYNDVYRYVPLNGDIAGLCARTDATNDPWWSPAGPNRGQIKNVVQLLWNPSLADRNILYPNSINPVVSFPGEGTMLYGDKTGTLQSTAFGYINVRRLFISLEKTIARMARSYMFQFNDEFTRSQFKNTISAYLRDVQSRRGITDFYVVCDTSNNTGTVVDAGRFIGDVYVKPARSINFIQLNFVAVGTSVQFSTVVGQF